MHSELVAEPGAGRVFRRAIRPGIADVAGDGRARLDAIARWLQDLAYLDLVDAGFPQEGAWIVRRMRVLVESFPRFGAELELSTFCSGLGRFAAERRSTIRAAGALVETVALWVYLDAQSWRPLRLPPDFVDLYSASAAGRSASVRLHHPDPPSTAERKDWSFRSTDLDIAGHVNNSHYWAPLEEELASGPEPSSIDAEVEFRDPASTGEAVLLHDGSWRWIAGTDGRVHASIQLAG